MKFYFLFILVFNICITFSQQDPDAKSILDKVANKTKSYSTIKCEFSVNINDKKSQKSNNLKGKVYIKGEKYRYESQNNIIYFDGKYLYTYYTDENEISISDVSPDDEDILNNPVRIINLYNKDFKYRYNGITRINNRESYEIDLFPKNLKQPYTRIKIFIDSTNLYLNKAIIYGKDGVDIIITLDKYQFNMNLSDKFFVIQDDILKKAEVIDLRKK